MSSLAYYNELDPRAAAWLRALIARGVIAPGVVDERSILDVQPADLAGYRQCHFFAGIGVWSYALRVAGWADATPVWTGSCPCQPFSASGKGGGTDDQRHLWPTWFRLLRECRPDVCFGEQVASKAGRAWLDFVSADLEGAGYAIGPCDTCAAGVGAPHIRQRIYFVAESHGDGRARLETPRLHERWEDTERGSPAAREPDGAQRDDAPRCGAPRDLDDTGGAGLEGLAGDDGGAEGREIAHGSAPASGAPCDVEHAEEQRCHAERERRALSPATREGQRRDGTGASGVVGDPASGGRGERGDTSHARRHGHPHGAILTGFWGDAEWILCRDGKARPVEPGSFPLADGAPARVGRLRGYGNALCAPQAAAFIEAYREVCADRH